MKKILLSLVATVIISLTSFGQAPEGFKYQAVIRDASSNPMMFSGNFGRAIWRLFGDYFGSQTSAKTKKPTRTT